MKLYLVQHGQSKPESEDPRRPLTERGREEVESVARYLARVGIKVSSIIHSAKLRAQQTAEIFAQALSPEQGIREQKGLGPLEPPEIAKKLILEFDKPIMLVGHLPHLSRLTSLLVLGEPEKEIINFRMGGVVCLVRDGDRWRIEWALIPGLILRQI